MLHVDGLEGRVAVVSGAARGIGRRIAEVLTDNGAAVAALDLRPPEIEGVLGIGCDVTDEDAVHRAFGQVERDLGSVAVLVLNAGVFPIVPFEEMTLQVWRHTLNINLTGSFICAKRALPTMREARYGRIVALGSSAGKTGGTQSVAAYAASKAGLMALSKSIASEYAKYGITSNALAPSLIDTDMIADTRQLQGRIPVGRLGTVDDVAALVAFLCSEHASYITGEVTDINGGYFID